MTKRDFMSENLPRVPDFMENLPKPAPWPPAVFTLGPPVSAQRQDPDLITAYFRGDLRPLLADVAARPDHYTEQQKEILSALEKKKPLPPGARNHDISELVMRFTEKTDARKQRQQIVAKAQKRLDPTVDRKQREEESRRKEEEAIRSYEKQNFPGAIKII